MHVDPKRPTKKGPMNVKDLIEPIISSMIELICFNFNYNTLPESSMKLFFLCPFRSAWEPTWPSRYLCPSIKTPTGCTDWTTTLPSVIPSQTLPSLLPTYPTQYPSRKGFQGPSTTLGSTTPTIQSMTGSLGLLPLPPVSHIIAINKILFESLISSSLSSRPSCQSLH